MNKTSSKIIVAVIVIALFAGGTFYFRRDQQKTEIENSNQASTENQLEGVTYKNGTYQATGNYLSPGGQETIGITLVVQGDKVTDATVVSNATLPTSQLFQQDFAANFKTHVIGKDLASLKLDKISGSSLTPKGFNDAVSKIQAEAAI